MTVAGQNLKDQIRKLVELQVMDEEIFRFKRELREKPAQLEALKIEFGAKKVRLNDLEDKLKAIQVLQKNLELDLKAKEEGIAVCDHVKRAVRTVIIYNNDLMIIR